MTKTKRRKRNRFKKKVIESWNLHDEDYLSDQTLLMLVADDCGCDIEDVIEVLLEEDDE